jgi:outer membrane lipoprotein-sorting protein
VSPIPALAAFARAWDGVTAYSATVTVFEQKGAAVQNVVFDYTFRKPSSFTVRVIKGPNAGVTLQWDGGAAVQATRGGGLFAALFKRSIPLHDPLVTTIRGSSIDELSFGAILVHSEQTPGTVSVNPGEPIGGTATESLSLIPRDPAADAAFTRETIDLSAATHLPVRVEAYEGTTLVRRIDFSSVKTQT